MPAPQRSPQSRRERLALAAAKGSDPVTPTSGLSAGSVGSTSSSSSRRTRLVGYAGAYMEEPSIASCVNPAMRIFATAPVLLASSSSASSLTLSSPPSPLSPSQDEPTKTATYYSKPSSQQPDVGSLSIASEPAGTTTRQFKELPRPPVIETVVDSHTFRYKNPNARPVIKNSLIVHRERMRLQREEETRLVKRLSSE